jgi:hypothetical protein
MPKKPKWYESMWKVIGALAIIFSLIASMLQVFGAVDFWSLLALPLYNLFVSSVSFFYVVLIIVVILMVSYSLIWFREHRSNILDFDYGRRIAILCQTPRTTDYLREKYEEWKSRSGAIVIGGYTFDDYMKRLEKQSYLRYRNGKWDVTDKALDYIEKYHGG